MLSYLPSQKGRPALPPRLVAGLLYLQHTYALSDEMVIRAWLENPYWPVFAGETYLQTKLPIDPFGLTRWRQLLGQRFRSPTCTNHQSRTARTGDRAKKY
jgi:IS5 family transposase